MSAAAGGRPQALFFTQQSIGLAARKTSMIFLAEAFEKLGYDVAVVTVQLSWLSALGQSQRLSAIPKERRNRWCAVEGMRGFIWVAPAHPVRSRQWVNRISGPLVQGYGRLMPGTLREAVSRADLIVIESCSAVALFAELKRINPHAVTVYSMSDRLDVVGMHPMLERILKRDAARYDLIRVPAAAMLRDLPGGNVAHIPHGLDTRLFRGDAPSPYASGPHAVLAGDMMLDHALLGRLAVAFPNVGFHYFGRTALALDPVPRNITAHGEVPFETLVPYIKHADVGLALYLPQAGLDYLAQSSLKNLQYAHCGLPIVAPHFVATGLAGAQGYDPDDTDSAVAAFSVALATPRGDGIDVPDWKDVAGEIIGRANRNRTLYPASAGTARPVTANP